MPQTLSAVVFDEADRLVESQHFEELRSILQFLKNKPTDLKRQTFVFSATLTFVHNNALMPGAHSSRSMKKFSAGKKMDSHAKLRKSDVNLLSLSSSGIFSFYSYRY